MRRIKLTLSPLRSDKALATFHITALSLCTQQLGVNGVGFWVVDACGVEVGLAGVSLSVYGLVCVCVSLCDGHAAADNRFDVHLFFFGLA